MREASNNDEVSYLIFLDVGYDNLDGKPLVKEKTVSEIKFRKHIFNQKNNCDNLFIFALVEFGCELLIPHYLLPIICEKNKDKNIIVVGWTGREFLYKHLADEFWEINEEYMWIKDATRALHHNSKNIKKLEKVLSNYGHVFESFKLGNSLMQAKCKDCQKNFGSKHKKCVCPRCHSSSIKPSFFANPKANRSYYKPLGELPESAIEWANRHAVENMIGIFARNRNAYGRNLPSSFYEKLVCNLRNLGYNPIWLGEKSSVHKCPDGVPDFSSIEDAKKLENIIALLKKCRLTIQFWTASTRLSLEANCPFLLVESPDQLYGHGQEGVRLEMLNVQDTPNKIILCNFIKVLNNLEEFGNLVLDGIRQLNENDYSTIIGMVDDVDYVKNIMEKYKNDQS